MSVNSRYRYGALVMTIVMMSFVRSHQKLTCISFPAPFPIYLSVNAIATCANETVAGQDSHCNMVPNTANGQTIDITPVTDSREMLVYKNIHCALCNGVIATNIIFWEPEIICKSAVNLEFEKLEKDLNAVLKTEECIFHFVPPHQDDFMHTVCYLNVEYCNASTSLQRNTLETNQCQGNPSVFGKGMAFLNKACGKCHGLSETAMMKWNQIQFYQPALSISVALNSESKDHTNMPGNCGPGRIRNFINGRCVKASCSLIRRLQDNECIRIQIAVNVFTYTIGIRLFPTSPLALKDAIDIAPALNHKLFSFLETVFGNSIFYKYEIIIVPDFAHKDWIFTTNVEEAFVKSVQWRLKLLIYERHDPEQILNKLLNASNEEMFILNISNHNVTFLIGLQDFKDNTIYRDPWNRCSPTILDSTEISLCNTFHVQNALDTDNDRDITFVRYLVDKSPHQYPPPDFATWPRSLLEYRACPFVEVFRDKTNWKEIDDGLEFVAFNVTIPFIEFVYGKSTKSVLICEKVYFKLYKDSSTNRQISKPWIVCIGLLYYVMQVQ